MEGEIYGIFYFFQLNEEVVQVAGDHANYIGDKDLNEILSYLGVDDKSDAANAKKKKKPLTNKKDDKKEKKEGASNKKEDSKKTESSARKEEDSKDDHKKEDSGGGGFASTSDKKNKKSAEKKISSTTAVIPKQDDVSKQDALEKELKRNGLVSNCSTSSLGFVGASASEPGTTNDNATADSFVKSATVQCKNTTKETISPTNDKVTSTPASSSCSNSGKRSKKGSGNKPSTSALRTTSSMEDLVSISRMKEPPREMHTTVDDGEVNKKRQKSTPRRNQRESASKTLGKSEACKSDQPKETAKQDTSNKNLPKSDPSGKFTSNQNKSRRSVDDITVKSSSLAKSIQGAASKKVSKRLSSSNSNLSSAGTKETDFGREFYEAGDPFISASASSKDISLTKSSADEFELVSRRKNRDRKKTQPVQAGSYNPSYNNNNSGAGNRTRWAEENAARDGYREYLPSNTSNRSFNALLISKNTSRPNSNTVRSSPASFPLPGTKKLPMSFEEAPRTPHDSGFMARLSTNTGGDRNTATSAPNSDCSDSDGDDSVHSMPTPSTTPRPDVLQQASSSDTTPQTSYANIARLASTANKNQIKRMSSVPQTGSSASAAASASLVHSAAACATSDQSLCTVWPKMSSSGGVSSATNNNYAATGAATSTPALSGMRNRPSETFASATASTHSSMMKKNQNTPPKFNETLFPPLKSATGSTVRQMSVESDILHSNSFNQSQPLERTDPSNNSNYSENNEKIFVDTSAKTSVQESSPLVSRNSENDSSLGSLNLSRKLSRGNTSSSVKENTPAPDNVAPARVVPEVQQSPNNQSINEMNSRAVPLVEAQPSKPPSVCSPNSRILQQVPSNIENINSPPHPNRPIRENIKRQTSQKFYIQKTTAITNSYNVNANLNIRTRNASNSNPRQTLSFIKDPVVFMTESIENSFGLDFGSDISWSSKDHLESDDTTNLANADTSLIDQQNNNEEVPSLVSGAELNYGSGNQNSHSAETFGGVDNTISGSSRRNRNTAESYAPLPATAASSSCVTFSQHEQPVYHPHPSENYYCLRYYELIEFMIDRECRAYVASMIYITNIRLINK